MPFQFRKEAIEEDLNSNFPSQGQGNPPLYYSLSEVVVPTYSINNVAEGTSLPQSLQQAWDFSTQFDLVAGATVTIINTPGFYILDGTFNNDGVSIATGTISITDGLSTKVIYSVRADGPSQFSLSDNPLFVFVRSGDSVTVNSSAGGFDARIVNRQIATVNGQLVNPLGFSFA